MLILEISFGQLQVVHGNLYGHQGKVVLAVRESQIIAEEEISNKSDSGQLPIMK